MLCISTVGVKVCDPDCKVLCFPSSSPRPFIWLMLCVVFHMQLVTLILPNSRFWLERRIVRHLVNIAISLPRKRNIKYVDVFDRIPLFFHLNVIRIVIISICKRLVMVVLIKNINPAYSYSKN